MHLHKIPLQPLLQTIIFRKLFFLGGGGAKQCLGAIQKVHLFDRGEGAVEAKVNGHLKIDLISVWKANKGRARVSKLAKLSIPTV